MHILYLDNHLLVAFKPPGLLAQADETGDMDILTLGKAFIKKEFDKPGNVFLGLAHRLDRPVSGVMVLARTSKAASRLTDQFRRRTTTKQYLAIVEGELKGSGEYTDHMIKDGRNARIVEASHPKGKRASLDWRVLGHQDGTTLVQVNLHTGRAHQIRLQFSSRGNPLLGDMRYWSKREFDGKNLALHAWSLGIEHPVKKEPMNWTAPPPKSWLGWYEKERETLGIGGFIHPTPQISQ